MPTWTSGPGSECKASQGRGLNAKHAHMDLGTWTRVTDCQNLLYICKLVCFSIRPLEIHVIYICTPYACLLSYMLLPHKVYLDEIVNYLFIEEQRVVLVIALSMLSGHDPLNKIYLQVLSSNGTFYCKNEVITIFYKNICLNVTMDNNE